MEKKFWSRFDRRKTLIASGVATSFGSLALSLSGYVLPWSIVHTSEEVHKKYVGNSVGDTSFTTTSIDAEPSIEEFAKLTSRQLMPDSPDFKLDSPDVAKFVGKGVGDIVKDMGNKLDAGWDVESIEIDAWASDETQLDKNAGLGDVDPENERLAGLRGEFIEKKLLAEINKKGIYLPSGIIAVKSKEKILNDETVEDISEIRDKYNYQDFLSFIGDYKGGQLKLTASEANFLFNKLDKNRGGFINIKFSRTIEGAETRTDTEYCEITEKRYFVSYTTTDTIVITILPLFIPWKKRNEESDDELNDADPKPDNADSEEAPIETSDAAVPVIPKVKRRTTIGGRISGALGRGRSLNTPKAPLSFEERMEYYRLRDLRYKRNRKIGLAALLLAIPLIRPYADNCTNDPNTTDNWPAIPMWAALGFGIPATDIETGPLVGLPLNPCYDKSTEAKKPDQPCGKKLEVYVDGKQTDVRIIEPPIAVQ